MICVQKSCKSKTFGTGKGVLEMYAFFTIDLPKIDNVFPKSEWLVDWMSTFGWSFVNRNKKNHRGSLIGDIKKQVRNDIYTSEDEIIFIGKLEEYQTFVLVTRVIESQIRVYVIHQNIMRLQKSIEKVVKKVLFSPFTSTQVTNAQMQINDNEVVVYDDVTNTIEMNGRVIRGPFVETIRRNRKDIILVFFGFVLMFVGPLISSLEILSQDIFVVGLTTTIVSFIGVFQTYIETFIEIKYDRTLVWN
jgi:hypothetical protein